LQHKARAIEGNALVQRDLMVKEAHIFNHALQQHMIRGAARPKNRTFHDIHQRLAGVVGAIAFLTLQQSSDNLLNLPVVRRQRCPLPGPCGSPRALHFPANR
jgi:hypothetical protein